MPPPCSGTTAWEGGRRRPFRSGYRPQFFFGGTDVTGTLRLDREAEPGSHTTVRFDLDHAVAFEPGVRFALREGGRAVGAGIILEAG